MSTQCLHHIFKYQTRPLLFVGFAFALANSCYSQDATGLEGAHRGLPTNLGEFQVGVSQFDRDPHSQRSQGIAEIGYVLRTEPDDMSKRDFAIIPFIRTQFESGEEGFSTGNQMGIGVDFRIGKLRKKIDVVFRLASDQTSNSGLSTQSNDEELRHSAGIFLKSPIGDELSQQEHIQRIRRLTEPHPILIEISESLQTAMESEMDEKFRAELHFLIVSLYILKVQERKSQLRIEGPDPFQSKFNSQNTQEDWLYEHLIDRYPLFFIFENLQGLTSVAASTIRTEGLLSSKFLIQDFLRVHHDEES